MLLVPAAAQLVQPLVPGQPRLVPGLRSRRDGSTPSRPRRRPPGRPSARAARGRARRRAPTSATRAAAPPASACRHVEEVVRLVEQQHLVAPRSSSSSANRFCWPPESVRTGRSRTSSHGLSRTVVATVSKSTSASYPPASPQACSAFGVRSWAFSACGAASIARSAAANRSPAADSAGGARLKAIQPGYGRRSRPTPSRSRRRRDPMLRDVADHADELAHHAEPAGARDRADRHRQVAGDHPQQRRLAGAVRPDQRDLGALADPERHVGEEHPAVRQDVLRPRRHPRSPRAADSAGSAPACRAICAVPSGSFDALTRKHPEALLAGVPLDRPAAARPARRCSESPPRCRATTSQATPSGASRGSQRSSSACSSALPMRIGGLDQISRTGRRPAPRPRWPRRPGRPTPTVSALRRSGRARGG